MNTFPTYDEHESQVSALKNLKEIYTASDRDSIDKLISWHTDQMQRITEGKTQQFYRDWAYFREIEAEEAKLTEEEKLNAIVYLAANVLNGTGLWDVDSRENVITLKLRNPSYPAEVTMTMNFKEKS